MRRALLVGSIAVLCLAAGFAGDAEPRAVSVARSAATAPSLAQLLGFVDGRLVRVDPETLRALPGRALAVGSGGCAASQGGTACWANPSWAVSPNGARVALALNDVSALEVVDAASIRVTTRLRWGFDGGRIAALAWLAPSRVLGVQETVGERQRLLAFDLARKRAVPRGALGGRTLDLAMTGSKLVLLLTPADTIGAARVAVVDARGTIRSVRLERIAAGAKLLGTGNAHAVDSRAPALAVDPQGGRAYVVAQDLIASVELRTLAVSYHSLERRPSLLSRLWGWLEPVAHAKQVRGFYREARWLGGGLLAVSGTDTADGRYEPAGLRLVDTRAWSARTLDRGATLFRIVGDALIATGGSWDEAANRSTGIGVAAYGFDGAKRFQVLDGEQVWTAAVYGGRAYVGIAGQPGPLRIIDLATGSVLGTREQELPMLLQGPYSWSEG